MNQLLTTADLYDRGWIDPLIAHLPAPTYGPHPNHQRSQRKVPLWQLADVQTAEQDPQIAAELARIARRRDNRQVQKERRAVRQENQSQRLVHVLTDTLQPQAIDSLTTDPEVALLAKAFHDAICEGLINPATTFERSDRIAAEKIRTMLRRKPDKNPDKNKIARYTPETIVYCMKALGASTRGGTKAGGLLSQLCGKYNELLVQAAEVELRLYRPHNTRVGVAEMLAIDTLRLEDLLRNGLYELYLTDYIPSRIRGKLTDLIAVDPKDEYPYARMAKRHFQIHVGGTNTGKTYQSLQRLAEAPSGVFLAPLRLLALEVQDNMLQRGVNCSLLTGEEEDLREGGTHISSTVEKLDVNRAYDVAVIDECQMIQDRDRGFAWTRAILGCCATEIHVCMAPEALDLVIHLIEACGDPYEVTHHERMVPLTLMDEEVTPEQAQDHDAFIAFSKRNVLLLADRLSRLGKPASVIYGALPYATRCLQMERFLQGETRVLVSTDAIGMGLNLPIRRIIFTADTKFDGYESRPLKPAEVKQIAGRAGRYNVFDEGFVTSSEPTSVIARGMNTPTPPVTVAMLGFSELVLRVGHDLLDVLRIWNEIPSIEPYEKMDVGRYIYIIELLRNAQIPFTPEEELRAASIPFDERTEELLQYFILYCQQGQAGKALSVPAEVAPSLDGLELYSAMLDLYYSCSRAFRQELDLDWLRAEKEHNAGRINKLLVSELSQKGKSCRMCHAPMPLNSGFRICKRCADKLKQRENTGYRRKRKPKG